MTNQCQACDEPAPSGLTICRRCETQTRYALTDQEAHRQELITALTRMTRMQAPNDGGRATNLALEWARMGDRFLDTLDGKELIRILNSLPPARKAADALHSQRSLLVAWCRLILDDWPPNPRRIGPACASICVHQTCMNLRWPHGPANSIASMSMYLHDHMRILRKHPAGGEFVTELRKLVQDIMRVIDLPTFRRFVVGLCIQDNQECPGQVWAYLPADEAIPTVLRCSACFYEWPADQWMRQGPMIKVRTESAA